MADNSWHLRKEVTIGNLMASLILLGTVAGLYYSHDTRISLLEQAYLEEVKDRELSEKRICKRLDRIEALQIEALRQMAER